MTDLTTLAAVKAYAGVTNSNDDTLITNLITAYSQWVRSFTSRDFTIQQYDIWRSGRGNQVLVVPDFPITAVSSLTIDGVTIPAAPAWGAYGYRYSDTEVLLSGGACFTIGRSNIHLVFTAGYATVPADLSQAVAELVALRYKMKGDNINWSTKSLAGESVTLNTRDMPASVATILKQYTNPVPA
jgi:hypothetical protein